MKTTLLLTLAFTATATLVSAQAATRYSVVPDATGGVWVFDNIRGSVSKCVRPEPILEEGSQPRIANSFEFYEDGNGTPNCSDWTDLSENHSE